jgi:hypothetical protein
LAVRKGPSTCTKFQPLVGSAARSILKNLVKRVPAVRKHFEGISALVASHDRLSLEIIESQKRLSLAIAERDALIIEVGALRELLGSQGELREDWSELKRIRRLCTKSRKLYKLPSSAEEGRAEARVVLVNKMI